MKIFGKSSWRSYQSYCSLFLTIDRQVHWLWLFNAGSSHSHNLPTAGPVQPDFPRTYSWTDWSLPQSNGSEDISLTPTGLCFWWLVTCHSYNCHYGFRLYSDNVTLHPRLMHSLVCTVLWVCVYTNFREQPAVSYKWTGWVYNLRRITDHFRGIHILYLKWMKEKPEDVNMKPVGFRITWILTDYA